MSNDLTEIPAGFRLLHTLTGHTDSIHRLSWSPDGSVLVSPSRDRTTRFWQDGKLIDMLKDSVGRSIAAAWSPDGERLALVADNDMLRLWNVSSAESERTRTGGLGNVTSVAWSPDNSAVVTGTLKNGVRLWDPELKHFRGLPRKDSDQIFCVAFSANGSLLAAGDSTGTIRVWHMGDGAKETVLQGHKGAVFGVAFSRSGGSRLASASADGTVRLWDASEGALEATLQGHSGAVHSVSLSGDDRLLASKSADGTVRVWSTEIEESLAVLSEPVGPTWLPGLAFHPEQLLLATLGNADRDIRIWQLDEGTLLGEPG